MPSLLWWSSFRSTNPPAPYGDNCPVRRRSYLLRGVVSRPVVRDPPHPDVIPIPDRRRWHPRHCDTLVSMPRLLTPAPGDGPLPGPDDDPAASILRAGADAGRLTYLTRLTGRPGSPASWPTWVPGELVGALAAAGIGAPWQHQAEAADLAGTGQSVIISTGTASGKSLGYLLPALTSVLAGGTVLYIAPTRALAADQAKLIRSLR